MKVESREIIHGILGHILARSAVLGWISLGPFAESSGCVSTGSRHVRVTNFQSGMMPVLASSENGSCVQPASCSSRTPDPSKNKVSYSICILLLIYIK